LVPVAIRTTLVPGEQEGEHRGGTPPLREVFPPVRLADHESGAMRTRSVGGLLHANFNRRCELLSGCDGRRSVPPAKNDDAGEAVNRSTVA
jgi:hypothetical protein